MLKDSGDRRQFESGAVRDAGFGKGRCDLMPLKQVSELLKDDMVLIFIDKFEKTKDSIWLHDAITILVEKNYRDMPTAILDLALQFEAGAVKYPASNWAKMIPLKCYVDSAIRHYLKHLRGDTDEGEGTHLRACLWNLICGWWTVENNPDDGSMETIYDV